MDETRLYKHALQDMQAGLMALDMDGRMIMFNAAAARILGISRNNTLGKAFQEIFFEGMETNDEFIQTILSAVYEPEKAHRARMGFQRPDGQKIVLAVHTSCTRVEDDDGETTPAVIVVFADVTEVESLREAERELNRKLQAAYLEQEQVNQQLQATLKKAFWIRVGATVFVLGLFVFLGLRLWRADDRVFVPASSPRELALPANGEQGAVYTVETQPLMQQVDLTGRIEPLAMISVVSPFTGIVLDRYVTWGQEVEKGNPLFRLDAEPLESRRRTLLGRLIKARRQFDELARWEDSAEVAQARRQLLRSKNAMASARERLADSEYLYKQGIIAETELQNAQETARNRELEIRSSEEMLQTVLDKGNTNALRIAEMELANAQGELQAVETLISNRLVRAPVTGVVLRPVKKGREETASLDVGSRLEEFQPVMVVGDLAGLSIHTRVDEVDVRKVAVGQKVLVSGEAFPEHLLEGEVVSVSSQARQGQGETPMFDVTIQVRELDDEQRAVVRLGMSCMLHVTIYEQPEAILVPMNAITMDENGQPCVRVRSGAAWERQPITTGMTTLDAVEVLEGLKPGDEILLPGMAEESL